MIFTDLKSSMHTLHWANKMIITNVKGSTHTVKYTEFINDHYWAKEF